jgi:hypothetical protein
MDEQRPFGARMRPSLTLARLRYAIEHGQVERVAELLPAFMEKTQHTPEYRETMMFDVARESLTQSGEVSAKLFAMLLDAGLDPNVKKVSYGGRVDTPISWTVGFHADLEDLPKQLHPELKWIYAVDRENWNHGSASPKVYYHPEVLATLIRGGADLSIAPVANQWAAGVEWHLDKSSLATLFADAAKVNNNPDLRVVDQTPAPSNRRPGP